MRMGRFFIIALVAIAVFGMSIALLPVQATFPGENGEIAFVTSRDGDKEIWVMNPDGTGQKPLTINTDISDLQPDWSPDGSKIAYMKGVSTVFITLQYGKEIWIMNADGTGEHYLVEGENPAWSPDGMKIAFSRYADIYVINIDGTGEDQLTSDEEDEFSPAWSPDGEKIAFVRDMGDIEGVNQFEDWEIWVMNADGTCDEPLTEGPYDQHPDWSPDGSKIVFDRFYDGWNYGWIFVMNADGSDENPLTGPEMISDFHPCWSPDGTKIVFSRAPEGFVDQVTTLNTDGKTGSALLGQESFTILQNGDREVWVMNADGTGQEPLTTNDDWCPDWGTYQPREPVGGEIAPISNLALIAPWMALAAIALTIGYSLTRRKLILP